MKRFFFAMLVAAVLSGCGSSVKLDKVTVEDKGVAVSQPPAPNPEPVNNVAVVPAGVSSGASESTDINAGSSVVSNVVASPPVDAPVLDTGSAQIPAAAAGAAKVVEEPVNQFSPTQAAVISALPRIIYFDYDSFSIRPEFQTYIEDHAKIIISTKAARVMIEGHTDERGGREYNLALGQKRAESVRQSLSLLGVAESQIEAISFGKEKPAATGASEEAMAKNRRAEISYR